MIDIAWIVAGGFAASTTYFALLARSHNQRADFWKQMASSAEMAIGPLRGQIDRFKAKEAVRQAQRVAASKSAAAKRHAKAEARKAAEKAEAKVCAARTLDALKTTPMRSRAQVVAPVKAARTRKKNAAAA